MHVISVNKAFFLADGKFGVQHVSLPELTVAAVLEHLGVTELCQMDKAEAAAGDVVVELAQKTPWTYNRYIFTLKKI